MQEKQNSTFILENEDTSKCAVSVGALLANARNQAALSQADIAEQINLSVSTIKALESDDFEQLPEPPYIRGYLRIYARVVGTDAESVIHAYNEQHPVESKAGSRPVSKPSYDPAILWSSVAVITILVGLLATWWVNVEQTPEDIIELAANNLAPTSSDMKDNAVSQISNIQVSNIDKSMHLPMQEDLSQISAPKETLKVEVKQAMEDESLNPNLITLNNGSDVLTVTYVEESWTEISDADLNSLMQGLIEPGVVRNLSGKAPFHVFLGNSPGVIIEVNGQYFDHSQFNRSNRTARFQVSNSSFN